MKPDIAALEARLEAVGAAPEDAQARVDAQVELAWEIRFCQRERSKQLAAEARETSVSLGYKLGQARAARVLCMTTTTRDTIRDLLALGREAKDLFDETDDRVGQAGSRDFLASLFEVIGDSSTGMELALEALSIAREIEDPVRQGYALSNVGGILAATGDVEGGLERLQEALGLFESVDDDRGVARICSRLSELCRSNGRLDDALGYARRVYDLALRGADSSDLPAALAGLGDLELERGNTREAERLFRESLALNRSTEELSTLMSLPARVGLGRLLAQRGDYREAEVELNQALEAFASFGVYTPAEQARVHLILAEVSEQLGDLSQANTHLREVIQLRERAAETETRDQRTHFELRAEMKAAKQEAEIHRLKFVELTQMQSKLVEAEKMAQLGTFAAGTAHELNNPLGVLRSNLSLYARAAERLAELAGVDHPESTRTQKLSVALAACQRTSKDAIDRIASVAESFRRFTSLDLAEKRTFNVVEGLQAAIALLRPNVAAGITLESHFEPVPDIEGWPGQLNQAFMTVLQNARQAIVGEGVVSVTTEAAPDAVVVRVSDTGRGMSESEQAHLFDVGWSEDSRRTKMRLGLAAAAAAVHRHDGRVEVESTPGQGTTFVFSFPAHSRG